jgi:DUF2892 family protein
MKQNISTSDKFIRTTLGGILLLLMYFCNDDYLMQWVFGGCGLYLIISSIVGTCIVYLFLDIRTASKKKNRFY